MGMLGIFSLNGGEAVSEDGERVLCRGWREGSEGVRKSVLVAFPAGEHPSRRSLDRLSHEFSLKEELDPAWAVRPLELVRERGRIILVLEDPGGEPLDRILGTPMEMGRFLCLAIGLAAVLGNVHERGLVHKEIKPGNILLDRARGHVRLTGFGIASRHPHERQSHEPLEFIEGALAYMAPEQTGRMNCSIDSRSDLYSFGVTLYQMLTGVLPFAGSDAMEWVHCHLARRPLPPVERLTGIPSPVSAIIMKLLAKTAEERYQTASGIESDLRRCLAEWESRRRISEFSIGEHEKPDRLLVLEGLYGRAHEIGTRLASFDRDAASGRPELVLVSGRFGIGKSAIVNELKALVLPRGFFSSGNSDQCKRDIPYRCWGADGKFQQHDLLHPHLKEQTPLPGPRSTIATPVGNLDLATVIKISQTVSGEIALETLIDKLMRIAIEHAGAERGVLILRQGVERRIEAEALTRNDAVVVRFRGAPLAGATLPESIIHYVIHTQESVILDDATTRNPFSADAYIAEHRARSILCLPLIKQATLIGALYLENNLMPNVFTPARVAVLQLLAFQATISLENTRLYADLEEREAKIRRLFDANIMGVFIWNLDGEIIDANEAFLQMVQYQREDLGLGRVRWTDLTPPEWRDRGNQALDELKTTGTAKPFEKEYFRKDGSRVPVLVGSAAFGGRKDEGVAFVIDLTERRRAEAEARASDRRCREIRTELEHANRVARLGHLSASIAHEVNQPIGATLVNAQTALRLLARQPPDVERATQAINRIVNDGRRAADILSRIRELVKKAPARSEDIEINEAILEVIGLTRGEMSRNGVLLQKHLTEGLPPIQGDRVQLQQVMLNLIVNAIEAMGQMPDGRRELVITTRTEADGVLVGVRDSGPGLSELALERAFDAFYTSKANGLGMGLSICRSIVEAHGGRLWASANVPHGAVFQFTLHTCSEQQNSTPLMTRQKEISIHC